MILSKCISDYAEHFLPLWTLHKIKLKCLKRGLRQQITENLQNDDYKSCQKQDMIWRSFFPNVTLIMLNNFYNNEHYLKIKFRCLKRGFSLKFTEKQQNGGYMTSYVKNVTWNEIEIFIKLYLWSCWTTLTMINVT